MKIADVLSFLRSSSGFANLKFELILFPKNAVDRMTCWRYLEFHEICHGMATGVLVEAWYGGAVGGVFE